MPELSTVADVHRSLAPMFASMLTEEELATLSYRVVPIFSSPDALAIDADIVVDEDLEAGVRWEILGEKGASGSLYVDDGMDVLVRRVQSDLQDFIAESSFGWGQYRGPHDLLD